MAASDYGLKSYHCELALTSSPIRSRFGDGSNHQGARRQPCYFGSFAIKPRTSSCAATKSWESFWFSGMSGGSELSVMTLLNLCFESHEIEEQSVRG